MCVCVFVCACVLEPIKQACEPYSGAHEEECRHSLCLNYAPSLPTAVLASLLRLLYGSSSGRRSSSRRSGHRTIIDAQIHHGYGGSRFILRASKFPAVSDRASHRTPIRVSTIASYPFVLPPCLSPPFCWNTLSWPSDQVYTRVLSGATNIYTYAGCRHTPHEQRLSLHKEIN